MRCVAKHLPVRTGRQRQLSRGRSANPAGDRLRILAAGEREGESNVNRSNPLHVTFPAHKISIEDFLQWAEQKPYLELIHGVVRPKTVPDAPHSLVQSRLASRLEPWSESLQGWVLTEQRCILEADGQLETVLPDVAWWSSEQLPALPPGPVRVPPTLAAEVLSPYDRYGEVQDKVLIYLKAGVAVVWIVDPHSRNVTIYRPGCPPALLAAPAPISDDRLPGLEIFLADVFARLPVSEDAQPRISD